MLLLNSAAMLLYYFSEMSLHKMEMREYIVSRKDFQSSLLTVFEPGDNFELVNKDEISSDGKMYDIVKIETVKGHTAYYAVSDDKEDILISDIARLTKQFPESGQRQEHRITIQFSKFVSDIQPLIYPDNSFLITGKYGCISPNYLSRSRNIIVPPPKIFFS